MRTRRWRSEKSEEQDLSFHGDNDLNEPNTVNLHNENKTINDSIEKNRAKSEPIAINSENFCSYHMSKPWYLTRIDLSLVQRVPK